MHILNKYGNLMEQADALEKTIPQNLRLEWMPTWFIWGIQSACSDEANAGLRDLLVQANSTKEQVEKLEADKKLLEQQLAKEESGGTEATRADINSTMEKIQENTNLAKQLVSILDH
eukprot:11283398-Karenia_brevis.AAC.1